MNEGKFIIVDKEYYNNVMDYLLKNKESGEFVERKKELVQNIKIKYLLNYMEASSGFPLRLSNTVF